MALNRTTRISLISLHKGLPIGSEAFYRLIAMRCSQSEKPVAVWLALSKFGKDNLMGEMHQFDSGEGAL